MTEKCPHRDITIEGARATLPGLQEDVLGLVTFLRQVKGVATFVTDAANVKERQSERTPPHERLH